MHVTTGNNTTPVAFPINFTNDGTYFATCIYNGDNHYQIGVDKKEAGSAIFKVYGAYRPIDIFVIGY